MARLKRPSNHPDVIREAAERAAATVQPSTHRCRLPIRAASPLRTLPSLSPSPPPSSPSSYSGSGTEFDAPPLVEIETEQPFYSESTSAATSPSSHTLPATSASQIQEDSELSERHARYILRVATQREARKKNPPPEGPGPATVSTVRGPFRATNSTGSTPQAPHTHALFNVYYTKDVSTGPVYSVIRRSLQYTTTLYTAVVRATTLNYAC